MSDQNSLAVKLTTRQRTFLARLMDIYRDIQKPVHYSVIAKSIGLCSSSAYDMLKVLEQKGMVSSQYHIPKKTSGPGRSSVMFMPTNTTLEQFAHVDHDIQNAEGWTETKASIMDSLEHIKSCDYSKLMGRLLKQADNLRSPLSSCAQILTALLISLSGGDHKPRDRKLVGAMLTAPVSNSGMGSVAGLILGLSLTDKKMRDPLKYYQGFISRYVTSVQNMNQEHLVMLQKFMLDVWNTLQPGTVNQY
jgi:hypothetical protein